MILIMRVCPASARAHDDNDIESDNNKHNNII